MRLRFPGHEHTNMVDGVPDGWGKKKIKDLGEVITGKTPSTKDESNFGDDIPFIKIPDMRDNVFVTEYSSLLSEKGAKTQANKSIPANSLMISCIGSILGVVALTSEVSQTNLQINTLIPNEDNLLYYCYFTFKDLKPRLEAIGGGATMPNVNKTKFESIEVVLPSSSLLRNFYAICINPFLQILNLQLQNQKLKQARDILLPKLINGEIPV